MDVITRLGAVLFNKLRGFSEKEILHALYNSYKIPNSTVIDIDGTISGKNVSIGHHSYINNGYRIVSGPNTKVVIGNYCAIGRFFSIASITHDKQRPTRSDDFDNHLRLERDTLLGNGVWVGDKVTIIPGVSIGNYSIIGANSVVTKDVLPFEIVGGVPAKKIGINFSHHKHPNNNQPAK